MSADTRQLASCSIEIIGIDRLSTFSFCDHPYITILDCTNTMGFWLVQIVSWS